MDALYDVLGIDGALARQRVDQKLRALRAELADVAFYGDDELAPVLLAIALTECRLAGCSLRGIGIITAKIYGKNLQLKELPTEVVHGKVQIRVEPDADAPKEEPTPEPAQGRAVSINELRADDMLARVIQIFGQRGFDFSAMSTPDFQELQDALRESFLSILGRPGVH